MATPMKSVTVRRLNARPSRKAEPQGYVGTFDREGVELRPLHSRDPSAMVYVTYDQIYRWGLVRNGGGR